MTGMTETRVLELIEAYGSEPWSWPDAERESAEALLRARPDLFSDALADARALEAALAAMPEPHPPAGLAERIIASAPVAAPNGQGMFARFKSLFSIGGSLIPSASALASAAVGLVIGYGTLGATRVADADPAEQAVFAAFGSEYDFEIGDIVQ